MCAIQGARACVYYKEREHVRITLCVYITRSASVCALCVCITRSARTLMMGTMTRETLSACTACVFVRVCVCVCVCVCV
jgi:hypothetical protein